MAAIDTTAHIYHVELHGMLHEVHVRHIGEDWSGITNQAERKKLQNRLNKRISRQRKRKNVVAVGVYKSTSADPCSTTATSVSSPATSASGDTAVCLVDTIDVSFSYCTAETITEKRALLSRFASQALQSYSTANPCADHRLKLIQLNIINGLTRNAAALGFNFDWLICEVVSPFGSDRPVGVAPVPETLAPTAMQLNTRHHPWVDLFPLPTLRNNLLAAAQVMTDEDELELYNDVLEAGGGRREWAGLVVWGEPWDPSSWEISFPFIKKWGRLLKGCPEILEATNHWRRQRGEQPITDLLPEVSTKWGGI